MRLREAAQRDEKVRIVQTTAKRLIKCEKSGRVIGTVCSTRSSEEQKYFAISQSLQMDKHLIFVPNTQTHTCYKSTFWGLELVDAELPNHHLVYGVIGSRPPVLIYQISSRKTRILIDIPNTVHKAAFNSESIANHVQTRVVPDLPTSVRPSVIPALKSGTLRSMPNNTKLTPGIALLGDAINMRHPLTGGGMTVALNDVVLLNRLLAPEIIFSLGDTRSVLKQMRIFHQQRKEYSMSLNILAQALYSLFIANDPQLQILQRGFIRYIQRGGNCVEEPAGLMGGVIHNRWLLFYDFFAVALYSLWALMREGYASSLWHVTCAALEGLHMFVKAVGVILPLAWAELRA